MTGPSTPGSVVGVSGLGGAEDDAVPGRPPALVLAIALTAAETLLLVVLAGYVVVGTLSGPGSLLPVVPLLVLPLAVAGGLVLALRGLARGRRWARAPIITWQLFQVVLLVPALSVAALRPWALAALLASVVVVVSLLTPAALRATAARQGPPPA